LEYLLNKLKKDYVKKNKVKLAKYKTKKIIYKITPKEAKKLLN
jgi:hypothetical protein